MICKGVGGRLANQEGSRGNGELGLKEEERCVYWNLDRDTRTEAERRGSQHLSPAIQAGKSWKVDLPSSPCWLPAFGSAARQPSGPAGRKTEDKGAH